MRAHVCAITLHYFAYPNFWSEQGLVPRCSDMRRSTVCRHAISDMLYQSCLEWSHGHLLLSFHPPILKGQIYEILVKWEG